MFLALLMVFSSSVHASGGPAPKDPNPSEYCSQSQGRLLDHFTAEHGSADEYDWAKGGTCIFRPIRELWAVINNHQLMVWKRVAQSRYIPKSTAPLGVNMIHEMFYEVHNPFPLPNVDWTMEWQQSLREGTARAPRKVEVTYNKIAGTRYIDRWNGTIALQYVSAGVTAVSVIDRIEATSTDDEDSLGTVRIVIEKLRTGAPNWKALP